MEGCGSYRSSDPPLSSIRLEDARPSLNEVYIMSKKTLLIGANGSEWSQAAVELGLEWARSLEMSVTCLGVVDVDSLTAAEPLPIGGALVKAERDARLLAEARVRLEAVLQAVESRARELGVDCRTRLVEGDPAEELGREVQRHDLMFIGKRAVPHSDHDPAPSKTMTEILHNSARPVVVVSSLRSEADSVLIAYDGSRQAVKALTSFVTSDLYAANPTYVVGVSDEPAEMEETLQSAVDYLVSHGRSAQLQVLPVGKGISAALNTFMEQVPVTLLVMGAYGQPKLKEILFGSVTRSMLDRAPVPLFLDH